MLTTGEADVAESALGECCRAGCGCEMCAIECRCEDTDTGTGRACDVG